MKMDKPVAKQQGGGGGKVFSVLQLESDHGWGLKKKKEKARSKHSHVDVSSSKSDFFILTRDTMSQLRAITLPAASPPQGTRPRGQDVPISYLEEESAPLATDSSCARRRPHYLQL